MPLTQNLMPEWTHKVAERAHSISDDARQRVHLAGDALLGHKPRSRWPAVTGSLMLGIVIGVSIAVAVRRPHPRPEAPTMTGNDDRAAQTAPEDTSASTDPRTRSDNSHSNSVASDGRTL